MSEQIHWNLEVAILPGQLENFRAVARDLIANTQKEADTLTYEWHLSADNTKCHIIERYRNSAALITHGEGFHAFAERFFQACRLVRIDIYGPVTEEAKAGLTGLYPNYYSLLGGFNR